MKYLVFILLLGAGFCFPDVLMASEQKCSKAEMLRMEANRLYEQEEYYDAIDVYIRCMGEAELSEEHSIYADCLNDIGYVYVRVGDIERALYYFKKGFSYAKTHSLADLQGKNATSLVSTYCFNNDLDNAKKYFKLQKSLPRTNPDIKYYFELFNTALIAQIERKTSLAIHYYKKSADYCISKKLGEHYLFSSYGLLVYTLMGINKIDEAMENCEKYKEYAVRSKKRIAMTVYFEMMRDIYKAKKDSAMSDVYRLKSDSLTNIIISQKQARALNNKLLDYEYKQNDANMDLLNSKISAQQLAIIFFVLLVILLVVFIVILVTKERKLGKAFRLLIAKNEEMCNTEKKNKQLLEQYYGKKSIKADNVGLCVDGGTEFFPDSGDVESNHGGIALTSEQVNELLNKIMEVMENIDIISRSDFNLAMLASITQSNTKYVSWTINDTYKKNFKSLLNEYRIREACRRLKDNEKYSNLTIQAIYKDLGYSSASNFIAAFKKVNGMTPSVYMRLAKTGSAGETDRQDDF